MRFFVKPIIALLVAGAISLHAESIPLTQAYVKKIINDVKIVSPLNGARNAKVEDVIKDDLSVLTGVRSRCELVFQDNTLTRLGAETSFSFKSGTRQMQLGEGTMLLQVPKDHGGAVIRAASVSASVTGTTIMMEHLPQASLKILVLEGSLKVAVVGRFGESLNLRAGQMILMRTDAKRLPNPVNVDIRKLIKTSSLIDPDRFEEGKGGKSEPLPSMKLIEKEASKQGELRKEGRLMETNLAILGNGSEVTPLSEKTMERLTQTTESKVAENKPATGNQMVPGSPKLLGETTSNQMPDSVRMETTSASAQTTVIEDLSTIPNNDRTKSEPSELHDENSNSDKKGGDSSSISGTRDNSRVDDDDSDTSAPNPFNTPGATGALFLGNGRHTNGLVLNGTDGTLLQSPTAGRTITLVGSRVKIQSDFIKGVNVNGGNAFLTALGEPGIGGDGGTINIGTDLRPTSESINIASPVFATTGSNALTKPFGGKGGSVNVYGDSQISVSDSITVSSRTSSSGGNILLETRAKSGKGIEIANTGTLNSLLDAAASGPGGTITFRSAGATVSVSGKLIAERGTVDIRNAGGGSGAIQIDNGAEIRGDVVKIGALGPSGELFINGGNLSADTLLKLYGGEASGGVRFGGNTTLGGEGLKIIAGKNVTIDNGKFVNIQGKGPANVFTDNPNFTGSGGNGSKTGTFTGKGAVTNPHSSRPGF